MSSQFIRKEDLGDKPAAQPAAEAKLMDPSDLSHAGPLPLPEDVPMHKKTPMHIKVVNTGRVKAINSHIKELQQTLIVTDKKAVKRKKASLLQNDDNADGEGTDDDEDKDRENQNDDDNHDENQDGDDKQDGDDNQDGDSKDSEDNKDGDDSKDDDGNKNNGANKNGDDKEGDHDDSKDEDEDAASGPPSGESGDDRKQADNTQGTSPNAGYEDMLAAASPLQEAFSKKYLAGQPSSDGPKDSLVSDSVKLAPPIEKADSAQQDLASSSSQAEAATTISDRPAASPKRQGIRYPDGTIQADPVLSVPSPSPHPSPTPAAEPTQGW